MDISTFESEVSGENGVVLVDFFGQQCPPCRMMSPILEEISRERSDLRVLKIDAAESAEVSMKLDVRAVPSFFLYVDGQVKGQFTGARSKADLLTWIDENK